MGRLRLNAYQWWIVIFTLLLFVVHWPSAWTPVGQKPAPLGEIVIAFAIVVGIASFFWPRWRAEDTSLVTTPRRPLVRALKHVWHACFAWILSFTIASVFTTGAFPPPTPWTRVPFWIAMSAVLVSRFVTGGDIPAERARVYARSSWRFALGFLFALLGVAPAIGAVRLLVATSARGAYWAVDFWISAITATTFFFAAAAWVRRRARKLEDRGR